MSFPFRHQHVVDLVFRLGVDQMNLDWERLQEPIQAVDGLYKVVELVPDTKVDRLVAVALEVRTRAGNDRLRRQYSDTAIREVGNRRLAFVEILRSVHGYCVREGFLDRMALSLEVVPDNPMICGVASSDDSLCAFDPVREAVSTF